MTLMMTSPYQPEIAAQTEAVPHAGEMLLAYPRGRHRDFQGGPAKVTVCVPVFDAGPALARCLDSVLSQVGVDFQVLVLDNASTDTSFGDACRYASEHDNVLAVQSPRDIGRIPNWNRCLEMARGEFIKFVMVHDSLLPGALECLARTMDRYPTVALARTRLFVREAGGAVHFADELPMSMVLPSATAIDHGMTRANIVAGPTVQMLRRAVIAADGLRFDGNYPWGADCVLAQQMLLRGDFAYVHESGIVMDTGADRFHRQAQTALKFHDQMHVILFCFRETGARPWQAEAVVARIQREYESHRSQTQDAGQRAAMEVTFVEALRQVEQCLTAQTRLAA